MAEDSEHYQHYLELASSPGELRDEIEEMVAFGDGDTGAYTSLDENLNLNAIAIGLGLENIEYEPEVFPGLVYRVDDPAVTAIIFGDGQITVIDAPDGEAGVEAIQLIPERLTDVGLYDGEGVDADEIEISQL